MGRVGDDLPADRLRRLLLEDGVDPQPLLMHPTLATISKARVTARQQQIVRVDREQILSLTSDELAEVERRLRAVAEELDAIILEDYGKGFITEGLMNVVAKVASEHRLLVTVDPSPRNPLAWKDVTLVKPNRSEAFAAAGVEDHLLPEAPLANRELLNVGKLLLQKWQVPNVLVTLGEQGMMLFQRGEPPHHIPTRAREVFDVSGAGDTAIALLTLALAAGLNVIDAADMANHASGIVVGKIGTARIKPDELRAAFED
jgi:D-beta-D-heptose 7-phosphate kinase/D-beta-D-heptose 1-phosphate adenosyltransferase